MELLDVDSHRRRVVVIVFIIIIVIIIARTLEYVYARSARPLPRMLPHHSRGATGSGAVPRHAVLRARPR